MITASLLRLHHGHHHDLIVTGPLSGLARFLPA
ncbi:hypothetical protein Taro_015748 [Colocasia esculenta]|uniref:Uncharacterized protein n=1 Tax=Colocasia esculenta TaxID=4460 RepID=A0A843UM06_COLES|nr:hypothetical protein [Colocasia esculenta]